MTVVITFFVGPIVEVVNVALSLADKQVVVADVSSVAAQAISLVAADYRGLSVEQMTSLRVKARKNGVYVRVVRNTLARKAFESTDYACVSDSLKGPLVLAFSKEDPGAAARLFRDFSKEHEGLKVQFMSMCGQLMEAKDLNTLAQMPTYDEAVAKLLSVMKAPVSKFVSTLAEPTVKFVRVLAAVKDSKDAA